MICHRDIKPENLLVIDLLHSKVVDEEIFFTLTFVANLKKCSPNVSFF